MAYVIGEDCVACGTCIGECPVGAISLEGAEEAPAEETVEDIAAYIGDEPSTVLKHYISLTQRVVAGDKILNIVWQRTNCESLEAESVAILKFPYEKFKKRWQMLKEDMRDEYIDNFIFIIVMLMKMFHHFFFSLNNIFPNYKNFRLNIQYYHLYSI